VDSDNSRSCDGSSRCSLLERRFSIWLQAAAAAGGWRLQCKQQQLHTQQLP
jgi:uncharacterized protein YbdZ (MbtH family)